MDKNNTLIGLHIPKTAGSSLRHALDRIYDGNEIEFLYRVKPGTIRSQLIQRLSTEVQTTGAVQANVIYGHMGFGLHDILNIEARYFAVLRDPVARAISVYRHEQRIPSALFHKEANQYSIEEFYRLKLSPLFEDTMTRMIAGSLWQQVDWFLQRDPADDLSIARHNLLNAFEFVGFTEVIDQQVDHLATVFRPGIYLEHRNSDPEPPDVSKLSTEALEIIHSRFSADVELYNFARKVFRQPQPRSSGYLQPTAASLL